MRLIAIVGSVFISCLILAGGTQAEDLAITGSDFNCMLDMQPVRGFYVDNLIEGKLQDTLTVARAEQGDYPPGSVVQLVPGEVMVKHPKGFSEATKDWEFFELNVSSDGAQQ
jgi:hypothetical protein